MSRKLSGQVTRYVTLGSEVLQEAQPFEPIKRLIQRSISQIERPLGVISGQG